MRVWITSHVSTCRRHRAAEVRDSWLTPLTSSSRAAQLSNASTLPLPSLSRLCSDERNINESSYSAGPALCWCVHGRILQTSEATAQNYIYRPSKSFHFFPSEAGSFVWIGILLEFCFCLEFLRLRPNVWTKFGMNVQMVKLRISRDFSIYLRFQIKA